MPLLRFQRDCGQISAPGGTTLLAAAGRARAPLGQSCRGQGVCNSCRVLVQSGQESLTPPSELERRWRLEPGWRLACQARIQPDAEENAIVTLWSPAWGGSPGSGDE